MPLDCLVVISLVDILQAFVLLEVPFLYNFHFGVLHPVAPTLSRLLEDPPLATTLQGVYFIFYIFSPHVSVLVGHLQVECTFDNEVICPSLDNKQTHIKKTTAVFAELIQ
jgi:hypothetical protein